ncbi:MAG: hypothetical protein ACPLKQ_02905 [Candidatus Bathyarchaeales archaeon]
MRMHGDMKGLSTLMIILLLVIAAIIGGIISYAFTIAAYVKVPEKTTLVITGFYFDKENASSFKLSVLNPSYSPTDATINGIAVSIKGENQLFYVAKSNPSIGNGLVIPSGESLNITCSEIIKDGANISLGEFVGEFAGKYIIVHIFSSDSSASNIEVALPFVKLTITADFNPQVSLEKFNVTLKNDANSEVNLTINDVSFSDITVKKMTPNVKAQPATILKGESLLINFNGSWQGINKTTIIVSTQQGYVFRKEVTLSGVYAEITNVSFNESDTAHFNVTIFNSAGSAVSLTLNKIVCTLENGTTVPFTGLSLSIPPNTEKTITLDWNWEGYRGKEVEVVAYFAQDFETVPYTAKTPAAT